ncbi:MAG: hypothetical protein K2M85_07890 [Paramuribaculum sp.]|nr:hypothetical protein [Paramuribaculum sp.]
MKHLFPILFSVVVLAGCHTGKNAAEGAAEKRAKFVADSIKYEAVKEAFTKGEFVFKINRKNNTIVSPVENWIIFSGGKIREQYYILNFFNYSSPGATRSDGPVRSDVAEIGKIEQTYDPKKKTITLKGQIISSFSFILTLYEGSDKAYGDIIGFYNNTIYEGWIEPLNDASIVRGWESPIYK